MKNTFRMIIFVLLVAGWSIAALALHVVRGPGSRVILLPKQSLDYHDTYVDTRTWTLDDVAKHPAVVTRLIQNGKVDVLQPVAPNSTGDTLAAELKTAMARGIEAAKPSPATKPANSVRPNARVDAGR